MAVAAEVAAVVTMLLWLTLCMCTTSAAAEAGSARRWRAEDCGGVRGEVTYDHRALVLNGTRRMLFSGEMHYPRSTPEVDECMCLYNGLGASTAPPTPAIFLQVQGQPSWDAAA